MLIVTLRPLIKEKSHQKNETETASHRVLGGRDGGWSRARVRGEPPADKGAGKSPRPTAESPLGAGCWLLVGTENDGFGPGDGRCVYQGGRGYLRAGAVSQPQRTYRNRASDKGSMTCSAAGAFPWRSLTGSLSLSARIFSAAPPAQPEHCVTVSGPGLAGGT